MTGAFERLHVEFDLLPEPAIDQAADGSVIADALFNLGRASSRRQSLSHQRIELGVLRLFHPVVPEQTFELRVEDLVIPNAVQVVALCHPFDMQDNENNS